MKLNREKVFKLFQSGTLSRESGFFKHGWRSANRESAVSAAHIQTVNVPYRNQLHRNYFHSHHIRNQQHTLLCGWETLFVAPHRFKGKMDATIDPKPYPEVSESLSGSILDSRKKQVHLSFSEYPKDTV